ncbi:hypothetical protein KY290_010781 [Solanum tuberosum]|uniref:GAG-pre-integrase domain-containing protein n=1 Tax=Solanum tuberosum TaxID=4113 RepID=A0ABQ7VYT8_SOLTU|nr:hypothetical protein KY290_010781 [Solanum tuberosum]
MTFRRDWFSIYETSGGTVLTGNNATCKIVGIGTLDKQGYKYMSEGGTMKVTKGSLVMLKARLEDGHYTLAGSTIIGSINTSTVQLSNDDKTNIWHMRLGHMNA